ncbi:type VI secretion system baseplate subunit TssF [Photobacterium sanctipauli]|nr:type VI secretion system baseplate subunit TssF [Photobacterium sanctipauli]
MKASLLLSFYKKELEYLIELGNDFSKTYPDIASRIGLDKSSSSDPYVEHLIESVAFLTSRIQYKIDAAYPRLAAQLIETMFPQVGQPLPSSCIFQLKGVEQNGVVEVGSELISMEKPPIPACRFTVYDTQNLNNAKIHQIETLDSNIAFPACLSALDKKKQKTAIILKISVEDDDFFSAEKPVSFYVDMKPSCASLFYQQFWSSKPFIVVSTKQKAQKLHAKYCQLDGFVFDSKNDIIKDNDRLSLESYRFGCEYFHFPQKFQFFSLDLSSTLTGNEQEIEVWILSESEWLQPKEEYSTNCFKFNCIYAVNRFSRRIDRINLTSSKTEYPLYADKVAPSAFEVLSVKSVNGFDYGNERLNEFTPTTTLSPHSEYMYELIRNTTMSNDPYVSETTEMFISLAFPVDEDKQVKQVALEGVCSNRRWPELIREGNINVDWRLESEVRISGVKALVGPSNSYYPPIDEQASWSLIQNIANQLTYILCDDPKQSAKRLRQYLSVFVPQGGVRQKQLCNSIDAIYHQDIVRKVSCSGIPTIARGLHIDLHINDEAYPHGETWLLGAVIERMLACWMPVNSFIELTLHSKKYDVIATWPIQNGLGKLL